MLVKQKIVIKLSMPSDKCRAKAMALVSGVTGVISVAITGDAKDQLEVVGEVDAVCLVSCLRKKKFGQVDILLVEEVKDKKEENEEETNPCCPSYPYCHSIRPLPNMVFCEDPASAANNCSIL